MDSLTQIALGATIGEVVLGKKVGNKAALWGAVAGTIPDLDAIPGRFMETVSRLDIHRGFSHSIIFCIVLAPIMGLIIHKLHKKENATQRDWTKLAFWSLITHPLLDSFTTWGTQLFWPLDYRIAFKTIFVVDPIYTIPLAVCLVWLLFVDRASILRRRLSRIGLALSTGYLLITVINKQVMAQNFREILAKKNVDYLRYTIQPTPFNNLLWAVTAETKESFYIGYYSYFDDQQDIPLLYLQKNQHLLHPYNGNNKIQRLKFLLKNYLTVESADHYLRINDLRFGLLNGWSGKDFDFVFSYKIKREFNNGKKKLLIERIDPDININSRTLRLLWNRMLGL